MTSDLDRPGVPPTAKPVRIRSLRARLLREVKADIAALDQMLAAFEQCYQMPSQEFYATYAHGKDGRLLDTRDFVAWGDLYVARLERELLSSWIMDQPDR